MSEPHVAVVGAGIIGLAVAYHLSNAGAKITIIDRDPAGDKASLGNAGGIAVTEIVPASAPATMWKAMGWMLDPLGPLAIRPAHVPRLIPWLERFAKSSASAEIERISRALADINARVYEDLIPMLSAIGMGGALHREGALTLYETETGYHSDAADWVRKRSHGIVAEELTASEARLMEPALGPMISRAVWTPEWSHISDPQLLVHRLREWLSCRGVTIWKSEVRCIHSRGAPSLETVSGARLTVDFIVIAAGAWSAQLTKQLGDRALLESERGYNTTLPDPGVTVRRALIFAERKFVATPLSCGLRIGGAAEFGGLKASADYRRSQALMTLANRYLPALRTEGGTCWAGHRPTTPDSLPVIDRATRNRHVLYAFGHGHLGLTQAATTGRLISELILQRPPSIDLKSFSISRFA